MYGGQNVQESVKRADFGIHTEGNKRVTGAGTQITGIDLHGMAKNGKETH